MDQWHSLYRRTSKIQNLTLFVTNIINQSEILFFNSNKLVSDLDIQANILSLERYE